MPNPFYGEHLHPDDWPAFTAEYDDWLALVAASLDENVTRTRSGGQVPPESGVLPIVTLGPREDASQKARRVERLARRLVWDVAADCGLVRAGLELVAGRRRGVR